MLWCARSSPSYGLTNDRSSLLTGKMLGSSGFRLFARNVCAAQQTKRKSPNDPPFLWRLLMSRVILSALMLVALLSWINLVNSVAVADEGEGKAAPNSVRGGGWAVLPQESTKEHGEVG